MFRFIFKHLRKGQRGFTLIEMIVSLALISSICLGSTIATAQVLTQTSRNNDFTTASRQALNAVHWISRDAQMAHIITGADGFPLVTDLVMTWTEWDNTEHVASYSLNGDQLFRNYSVDGGDPEVTLVAYYINSGAGLTEASYDEGVLTFKITSTVGDGDYAVDFTEEASISSRAMI